MKNYYYYSTPTGGTTINYVSTDTTSVQDKVDAYEDIDRFIAERVIKDNLKEGATDISITPTDIKCSVDLNCSCTLPVKEYNTTCTYNFNVEIKTMNKTEEQFKKYPDWMLRVEKWKRMKAASKGRSLFYLVLCPTNNTGYLFHVDNMEGIRTEWIWMKKCQMDDNSEYILQECFQIPISKAIKKVDLKKYFEEYADNKQAN